MGDVKRGVGKQLGGIGKGLAGLIQPTTKRVQGQSQATPLANDVLDLLMKQITGGTFGSGFGPLQQQAGTSAQQFVNSGGGQFDTSELFKNLGDVFRQNQQQDVAQLRENYGGIGGRLSSGAAGAEADLLAKGNANFGAQLGEISRQEFGNQQNRLLQGIQSLFQMGTQATQPFFDMASLGILPETIAFGDSPLKQFTGIASGLFGKKPS